MKTANIDAVPKQWADIVGWLGAGEEVELRRENMAVAKVIPLSIVAEKPAALWPDFVARAHQIWGNNPDEPSLTEALLREREERM